MSVPQSAEEMTPTEDRCAICDGVFIDHRYGALGHDWVPKPPPLVDLSEADIAIAQTAATARADRYGY